MSVEEFIGELMEKSRAAQKEFENNFNDQEEIDQIVRDIGKVVFDNAEKLAEMTIEETEMGVYEDKVQKNKGKARIIWDDLRGKQSIGVINREEETGLVDRVKPVGVVGTITPVTNPGVTCMCNAMFALKGRNSVIISPHPASKDHINWLVDLFREVLVKHDAPKDLIQLISDPTIELTNELMSAVDVVVATGGAGMVKAAYGSGTPALGVGPGNIQCIIDQDADIEDAIPKIIKGRIFDNGIICSGEQTAITPEENFAEVVAEFKKNGTYYVEGKAEKEQFKEVLFPEGEINRNLIGQSVQDVAKAVGVDIPEDKKMIMIKEEVKNKDSVLRKEKMFPVITAFEYENFAQAVEIAQNNLEIEGKGHTVCIHSHTKENIEKFAQEITASRVVTNAPCATTAGGSFQNGFSCTTTLGCGSWGNNSISENLTYTHLLNTTTIGYKQKEAEEPTDEELWNS